MVIVEIAFGDPTTEEYGAAEQLRDMFERDLRPDEEGRIVIVPNLFLWGQRTRQVDLLVIGQFGPGFCRRVRCAAERDGADEPVALRNVYVKNFCWCVEVKDHDHVRFQGATAIVRYNDHDHDVSAQSDRQLHALRQFLKDHAKLQPYICNLIWFRNLDKRALPAIPHNCVGKLPTLEDWLERAFVVHPPRFTQRRSGPGYYLSACAKDMDEAALEDFEALRRIFAEARDAMGQLTRDKVELITRKLILSNQHYAQAIGQKLVVIRGRAGTGKTVKLLRIAYDLAERRGERCLILTYNKALVADIQRLMALAMVPDDVIGPTVDVRTVHAFMRSLMIGLGIYDRVKDEAARAMAAALQAQPELGDAERALRWEQFEERFFLDHYDELKAELLAYLRGGAITAADVAQMMTRHHDEVAWDVLLIDESQDWPADERDILFTLFEPRRFVIADGVDQFVRSARYTDWLRGVDYHKPIVSEKRSLRQKTNLCAFVGRYAQALRVPWDVQPSGELSGGRVLITPLAYHPELHERLRDACLASGNQAYEMMFLVPPSLVDQDRRCFKLRDEWEGWGIELWDGTSPDLRAAYPSKLTAHRVLQYDSCRGLEGWTVVCLHFDEFVQYKLETAPADAEHAPEERPRLALRDPEEERRLFAARWSLIPLTRAIDTLVITLRDAQSETGRLLRDLARHMPDCVEWLT
ncbi:MAG: AAA family ATPase [Thermoflexales bacterium]|nr:AAA family ATPase [Thermoflexales bacterium]MDW8352657.1 AAA family ATPase [Anaerolineae bacterium]